MRSLWRWNTQGDWEYHHIDICAAGRIWDQLRERERESWAETSVPEGLQKPSGIGKFIRRFFFPSLHPVSISLLLKSTGTSTATEYSVTAKTAKMPRVTILLLARQIQALQGLAMGFWWHVSKGCFRASAL